MCLAIGLAVGACAFQLFVNLSSFILEDSGFTTKQVAVHAVCLLAGIVSGSVSVAVIVDRTKRYVLVIKLCYAVAFVAISL